MYELFMDNIPYYSGKICVPISGGLDSRVIAGIMSKKRKIDLAFCQYELPYPIKIEKGIAHVQYARQIAGVCGVERFIPVNVNQYTQEDMDAIKGLPNEATLIKSKMYTGLRKLNEQIDTSEYTFITGHGLDSFTGVGVNPLTLLLLNPYKNDQITKRKKEEYFGGIFDGTYGKFGKWDCPLWNDEVEDFCLSLPLGDRYFQKLYRQMITKYFPELAKINREGMNCPVNVSELRYIYARAVYFGEKLLKLKQ